MPSNLNALIRYKTINSCLYGGKRKWSIHELINACSDALGECRGRYQKISERTLRDDLRVMKSDILGFNAPIEQHKGLYWYADPEFSIMKIQITDSAVIDEVLKMLQRLRKEMNHPELEMMIEKLMKFAGAEEYKKIFVQEKAQPQKPAAGSRKKVISVSKDLVSERAVIPAEETTLYRKNTMPFFSYGEPLWTVASWEEIFSMLPQ